MPWGAMHGCEEPLWRNYWCQGKSATYNCNYSFSFYTGFSLPGNLLSYTEIVFYTSRSSPESCVSVCVCVCVSCMNKHDTHSAWYSPSLWVECLKHYIILSALCKKNQQNDHIKSNTSHQEPYCFVSSQHVLTHCTLCSEVKRSCGFSCC